jgi:hypothetical protein
MKTNPIIMRAATLFPSKLAGWAAAALIAVVASAVAWQAMATPPSGGGSAGNSNNAFAVGGITTLDGHVAFAAHQNPNGSYSGHVVQDSFGTSRSGPVDCLFVVPLSGGNHATIQWHVTHSDNPAEVNGQPRLFEMCDYGEPTGGVSPDYFVDLGESNNGCRDNQFCGSPFIHGNIVVKWSQN